MKKQVVVMGNRVFTNYKASNLGYISALLDATKSLKNRVETYKRKVKEGNDLECLKILLKENEVELPKPKRRIEELKGPLLDYLQEMEQPQGPYHRARRLGSFHRHWPGS